MELATSQQEFTGTERYTLRGRVGQGGMGVVYHAFDKERQEEVALKTLQLLSPQALLLFKQEFRGLVDVVHPNLVSLYELSTSRGVWFITMELIRGCNFLEHLGVTLNLAEAETLSGGSPIDSMVSTRPLPVSPNATMVNPPDLEKLRDCTIQLVRGVQALHAAGKLHRDIKPSNVLVTTEGRVVLVDFGLVTEIAARVVPATSRPGLRGTLHYMAPELIGPERTSPGPASDWYSLGVMLYEALTGIPPYSQPWQMLGTRPPGSPRPPSSLVAGIPVEFDDLCLDLLRVDSSGRPSGPQILARLGGDSAPLQEFALPSPSVDSPFVGRVEHLQRLREALARTRIGEPQIALVSGPSGVGKTTLVRRFLDEARTASGALTFEGRCYDGESVPYKAVDSLIDRLAEHLSALDSAVLGRLLTPDFRFLAELFPVLKKVERAVPVDPKTLEPEDLPDRRRRAFGALRLALAGLSADRPLVLFIDDLQWTDLDSGALLAEVLALPGPPPLLLIACRRSGETGASEQPLPVIESLSSGGADAHNVEHLRVDPLSESEARQLAEVLVNPQGGRSQVEVVRAIASESAGYPMFIQELARDLPGLDEGAVRSRATLEELLAARIGRLSGDSRRLLDAIVVAGRPVRGPIVAAAAGVTSHDREAVAALRAAGLVVVWGSTDTARLEAAHDRIRQVVWAGLPEATTRALHEGIAVSLEREGATDLEALFEHFLRAGKGDRAAEYAVRAAEQADRALAFERSAELFQEAVHLLTPGGDRSGLLTKAAGALANAGHATRAAEKYLEAAAALAERGESGTRPRTLRRLAAEQHLKNGDLGAGWRVMRQILDELKIPVPGSHGRAIIYSTWRRLLFLLRATRLSNKRREQVPAVRENLEVLWAVSTSFSMVNVLLSDAFRGRHLLEALKEGDPSMASRALVYETAMESFIGGRFFDRNCQRLLEKAGALVEETGNPYDRAWLQATSAVVSLTRGRLRESADLSRAAERLYREQCPGSHWERSTAMAFLHEALAASGNLAELRRSQESYLAEMTSRRTLYGVIEAYNIRDGFLTWIAADRPEEAYEVAAKLLAKQTAGAETWPEGGYRAQHAYVLTALVHKEIYRGRPAVAWEAILAQWKDLRRSFFLSLKIFKTHLPFQRGRAAVALAAQQASGAEGANGDHWTTERLLADARKMAHGLSRDPYPAGPPWANVLQAGIASTSGDSASAKSALESAVAGFDRAEMLAYREVARYALSGLMPAGSERSRLRGEAADWLRGQGVVHVDRFVVALCPGIRGSA